MNILKSPYLEDEVSELNSYASNRPNVSKQMYSPFLTESLIDEEYTKELLEDDYEVLYTSDILEENEFEQGWDDDFEEDFVEEAHDDVTYYDDYQDSYDESELEEDIEFIEKECSCHDNEFEDEFDASDEGFLYEFEQEHYDEDEFKYQDEIEEGVDNEFYDYEGVEEEFVDGFYNYEDAKLEEAFFSSFRKYFDRWTQKKKASNPTPSLPQKSASGRVLKLPIVSSSLPDSKNYLKTKNSPDRYFGIPETIAALQWIGKEWVKLHSNVQFIIRDISQMGGGRISGHGSHRMGIDVDVKLQINGRIIIAGSKNYSSHRKYVRDLINLVKRNPYLSIAVIGFQDRILNKEFGSLVRPWSGHASHLHLRFCMPSKRISQSDFKKVYPKGSNGSFKTCVEHDVKYTSPLISSNSTTKPQTINIQEAINYNNRKKQSLGWAKHIKLIQVHLNYPTYSPSDSQFAEAVATWQKNNGFKSDGKLGPKTWSKMKSVLGITNNSPTKPPTNLGSFSGNKNVRINRDLGWGGWKGNGTKGITKIPTELMKNNLDVAVAVASVPEGGAFDNVNMYDKGILSWGIKQWTVHAGSLQGLLMYIKEELKLRKQIHLWSELFPGLDIRNKTLYYNGVKYSTSNKIELMKLFRGTTSKVNYNEDVNRWIKMFAIAGRHPLIQKFQFEYAKKELEKKLMQKNLGKTLRNNNKRCSPKKSSWCRELRSFGSSFKVENYGVIGKYIEGNMKALALFNGMATQNPMWTYIYLKRAIDVLITRYGTANTDNWPGDWQKEFSIVLENLFAKSGVATWGTAGVNNFARKNPKKKRRQSRTSKLLKAFRMYSVFVK